MATGSVFENKRSRAVRIPAETRSSTGINKAKVRIAGLDRVLSPVDRAWDTFFAEGPALADDRLLERAEQGPPQGREPLQ